MVRSLSILNFVPLDSNLTFFLLAVNQPRRGFAYNPDGRWGFNTAQSRVRRRVIRADRHLIQKKRLTTDDIAKWTNLADAFTFRREGTQLHYQGLNHAVVVGELIPAAARIGSAFSEVYKEVYKEAYKELQTPNRSLPRRLKLVTVDEEHHRCLIVRLTYDVTDAFFVLGRKDAGSGLCWLYRAPEHDDIRHYIAFYDEWVGHSCQMSASETWQHVKRSLDDFCKKHRETHKLIMRNTSPRPAVPSLIVTLKTGLLRKTLQPAKPRPKTISAPNSNTVQNAKQASPTPSEQQEQIQSPSHNNNPPPTTKDVIKSLQPESQSGSEASNIGSDPASHARSNHTESQVQQETEQNSKSYQTPQILPAEPAASQVTKLDKYLAQLFAVDAEYTISNAAKLLKETKASTFAYRIAPTADNIKVICNPSPSNRLNYMSILTDLARLLRSGALNGQCVQPEFRACIVGEWCRRFHFYGNQEWETKRVLGRLPAELCDV